MWTTSHTTPTPCDSIDFMRLHGTGHELRISINWSTLWSRTPCTPSRTSRVLGNPVQPNTWNSQGLRKALGLAMILPTQSAACKHRCEGTCFQTALALGLCPSQAMCPSQVGSVPRSPIGHRLGGTSRHRRETPGAEALDTWTPTSWSTQGGGGFPEVVHPGRTRGL